ncbi:hypothetical protein OC844_005371, partial [Tilletia horrida]
TGPIQRPRRRRRARRHQVRLWRSRRVQRHRALAVEPILSRRRRDQGARDLLAAVRRHALRRLCQAGAVQSAGATPARVRRGGCQEPRGVAVVVPACVADGPAQGACVLARYPRAGAAQQEAPAI